MLVIVKADTLDDAIKLINRNKCKFRSREGTGVQISLVATSDRFTIRADGNGASAFTQSGATARYFEKHIEAGQVGLNVPIPCVRRPLSHAERSFRLSFASLLTFFSFFACSLLGL